MNEKVDKKEGGIVLLEVLMMLTLLGLTGVVFVTYSTAERQCEQNPTVEVRDGRCIRQVGKMGGRP